MKKGNSRLLSLVHIKDLFALAISKQYGYSYHELVTLKYIKEKGAVSQRVFAKRLRLDKSSVTKIVNKLVGEGLIVKVCNKQDMRNRILMPTEKLLQTNIPSVSFTDSFFEFMLQDCSDSEIIAFYTTISKLQAKAKAEQDCDFENLIEFFNAKSEEI